MKDGASGLSVRQRSAHAGEEERDDLVNKGAVGEICTKCFEPVNAGNVLSLCSLDTFNRNL